MNKFTVWQAVKFRDGHKYEGSVGVVQSAHDDSSIIVRILRGQKGAGCVIAAYPEAVEEYEVPAMETHETSGDTPPPPDLPDEPTFLEKFLENWKAYAAIAGVTALLAFGYFRNPETGSAESAPVPTPPVVVHATGSAQLFVELQTSELNRLNAEDVADMAAVKEARDRMEARKAKKEEILRTLTPYR